MIMVEYTDAGDETVRVFHHREAANICVRGEDVTVGQTILSAGTKLDAARYGQPTVVRRRDGFRAAENPGVRVRYRR